MKYFRILLLINLLVLPTRTFCQEVLKDIKILTVQSLDSLDKKVAFDSHGAPYTESEFNILIVHSDMDSIEYGPPQGIIQRIRHRGLDTLYILNGISKITIRRQALMPFTLDLEEQKIFFDKETAWEVYLKGINVKKSFNISITTDPADATILLDDEALPDSGRLISEGRHRIKIEKVGFETVVKDIYVSRENHKF